MIKFRLKEEGIDIIDTVLTNRGLDFKSVKNILNPDMACIESPMLFTNMDKAVKYVLKAIEEGRLIVIPIDSDCDGWCSASQLYHFIRYELGYENVVYFFHSNPKAHGFTDHVVKKIKELGAGLVIMCDGGCGDNDRKKYQTVLDSGADIVILDHHPFEGAYQDEVALVNCYQKGGNTNTNLSGAGVTYKFLEALSDGYFRFENSKVHRYRDLVALSLVSDLMDLRELENRALLSLGVEISELNSPFIKRLVETKKMEGKLTIEELGFNIAPLINASVRFGTASDKEKIFRSLVIEEDVESEKRGEKGKGIIVPLENEAVRIATNLKKKQDNARDKAVEKLLEESELKGLNNYKVFVADVTDYAESEITGLVANKALDYVNKPILLLRKNKDGNGYTGSARGLTESRELPSFKKECLESRLFDFCSGHENAFGVAITMPQVRQLEIKKEVEEKLTKELSKQLETKEITKREFNKMVKDKTKEVMECEISTLLEEVRDRFDKIFVGIEFFDGYEVDGVYHGAVPLADVKDISKYEELWCNNIKAPLFMIKDIKMKSADIEKVGNATYTFKVGDVKFTKNFGSRKWYAGVVLDEELPFGGDLICDIVVKFRKNKKGYCYCDIVDMKSRENLEEEIDF